jgi:hypothetical protein
MNLPVHQTSAVKTATRPLVTFLSTRSMPSMAARFWADVSFAVGNSGTSLTPAPDSVEGPKSSQRGVSRRVSSSCTKHRYASWALPTQAITGDPRSTRSLEDEAFQDVLSQSHGLPPSTGRGCLSMMNPSKQRRHFVRHRPALLLLVSTGDLGPHRVQLPGAVASSHRTTRTDSRTYIKRVVPQHLEIQSGERFHHEVNAYEER